MTHICSEAPFASVFLELFVELVAVFFIVRDMSECRHLYLCVYRSSSRHHCSSILIFLSIFAVFLCCETHLLGGWGLVSQEGLNFFGLKHQILTNF